MTLTTQLLIGAATLLATYLFLRPRKLERRPEEIQQLPSENDALPSLLIPAYTSHARFLPHPARHAFSYPLLYLGVDIDSLEAGSVDIGRVVKYGGSPSTKILGLRSDGYLEKGPGTLRQKVNSLLEERGAREDEVGRVWLVTIPSFVGFEGINPLSVWFCYKRNGFGGQGGKRELACVILEVHNTFGEK